MIRITPGQALLILIDVYGKNPDMAPPITIEKMKRLYLSGANNEEKLSQIRDLYKDPALNGFEITERYSALYKDPTRRYFETHLAYQTQSCHISDLSLEKIRLYAKNLIDELPTGILPEKYLRPGTQFPKGTIKKEYYDALKRLSREPALARHLVGENLEKAELLIKSCLMGVISGHYVKTVVDIHRTGFYHPRARGRIAKDHRLRGLHHYGILRSTMPLRPTDIAHTEDDFKISKPSENSRYDKSAAWPQYCFAHLTQSFSNSISGANLRQAQIMAHLLSQSKSPFVSLKEVTDYFKLMISSLMFISGGHTLFEFSSPLFIPELIEHFHKIPGARDINFESLFFDNNEDAFNRALDSTIAYNIDTINKKRHLAQIVEVSNPSITGLGTIKTRADRSNAITREKNAAESASEALVSLQRKAAERLSEGIAHRNRNSTPSAGAAAGAPPLRAKLQCIIM